MRKKSMRISKRVEILKDGEWTLSDFNSIQKGDIFRFKTRKSHETSWDGKELFYKDCYCIDLWDEPFKKGKSKGMMRRVIEISQNGESGIRARKMD
jgi:hypothetical protein